MRKDWETPAEALRKYSDIIKVLHVHDNNGRHDDHFAPFFGTIDWKDFSRALKESCFEGVLSLECSPTQKLPANLLDEMYRVYHKIGQTVYECGEE